MTDAHFHVGFDFWIIDSRCSDSQISRFTDFQTPPSTRRWNRSRTNSQIPNLPPLPTHPDIKYVVRSQEPLLQILVVAETVCEVVRAIGQVLTYQLALLVKDLD